MEGIEANIAASMATDENRLEHEFYCQLCNKGFSAERSLVRHLRHTPVHNCATPFACSLCSRPFSRKDVRDRHERLFCGREGVEREGNTSTIPAKRTFAETITAPAEQIHRNSPDSGVICSRPRDVELQYANPVSEFDHHDEWASRNAPCVDNTDGETANFELLALAGFDANSYDLEASRAWLTLGGETPGVRQESDGLPSHFRIQSVVSTPPGPPPCLGSDCEKTQGRVLLEHPSIVYNLPNGKKKPSTKRTSIVLKKFGNVCTICGSAYEPDSAELYHHLYGHFESMEHKHSCSICKIGFARKGDLDHHLSSAKEGSCGFRFAHARPCTGHHSPAAKPVASPADDHDRFQLSLLLGAWELSQLHVHQASVQRLDKNTDMAAELSRLSLSESTLRRRASFSGSLVYSLRSFRSEPHADRWDEESALESIRRKMGRMAPRTPLGEIRQGRQKLEILQAANSAIGPAASQGDQRLVERLLAQGANVDIRTRNGTPLMMASAHGHCDVVSLLIEHGASLSLTDSKGETALHKACGGDHADVVRTLIRAGADLFLPNTDGDAPLNVSILNDSSKVVDVLLDGDISLDYSTNLNLYGDAMLHLAVEHGAVATAKVLLSRDVDPDVLFPELAFGLNPLHDLLVLRRTREELPATPMDRARALGMAEMAELLHTAGGHAPWFKER